MENILIVGGGIGGLTAALALQAHDCNVEVFEAAPELEPVGKGIWVPPNAMQVFERLGLDEAIAERGLTLDRVEIRDGDRGVIQSLDLNRAREKYGHAITSIHRARLQQALVDQVNPDTLHLGKECVGFEETDSGRIAVQFQDGTEEVGDLLAGADGIHSVIRQQLFPTATPRYAGQTCYRGVANIRLDDRHLQRCAEVWGGDIRFGFSAIGRDEVYWFAPISAPAGSSEPSALVETLLDRYATFPAPIPEIIRHTPDEEIIRTDLYDLPPLDSWARGHVVLLGDAAHAMTPNLGQGGAQAIEDGFVLGRAVADHRDDLARAVDQYEQLRVSKVKRLVRMARVFGTVAHVRNRWIRTVRNWVLRHIPERMNRKQVDEMYALNY